MKINILFKKNNPEVMIVAKQEVKTQVLFVENT
jgi:hypothetical protein